MKSDLRPLKTHRRQNVKKRELKNLRNGMSPEDRIGAWLSAALEDPMVCDEMKQDIKDWFDQTNAEQEPVAWRLRSGTWFNREVHWRYIDTLDGAEGLRGLQPLYTAPPKQWVGLTAPEVQECYDLNPARFARAVEAKLREKNT